MTGVSPASAAIDFSFSFDNTVGNVNGTVTGIIGGLEDNATGAATSLEITSFPAGLGTPVDGTDVFAWDRIFSNQFTVTNGLITAADFVAYGFDSGLCIDDTANCFGGAQSSPVGINNALTFDRDANTVANFDAATASVPFEFSPTFGLLLVGGLLGGNHFYRRHKASKIED